MLALSVPSGASASGPDLRVPAAELDAALECPIDPANATKTPLMFVTGTGASGDIAWFLVGDMFRAPGHPGS